MNHLYAACLLLLFVSFAAADHHTKPTFCSEDSDTKCNMAGINITCVKQKDCTKYVAEKKGTLTLADSDDLVKYAKELKIVYAQKLKGLEKFVKYYGLAVVEKNSTIKLDKLKGVNSCHTGVGKTVGWKIPVGYLLYTKKMTFTKDQYTSASNFFGDSCAPGIKDIDGVSKEVQDDFCKLCNSTCKVSGSDRDDYAGYEGAFKCMADGNNDRVGFVKQTTAKMVFADDKKYGNYSDYKLLCKDGKTKDLLSYKDCNIDKRPLAALVTSKDTPDATIEMWQDMLKKANRNKLADGGIVSSDIETLELYTKNVTEYVGDYGHYYNALTDQSKTNSAPPSFLSFALQAIAIFAFMFLA